MLIKKVSAPILIILFTLPLIFTNSFYCKALSLNPIDRLDENENEIKIELENIYNLRSNCFVTGDLSMLQNLYDTSSKYGKWALEHEVKRVKYLKNWASAREMKFTEIKSEIRINKIYSSSEKNIRLNLEETYNYNYIYNNDASPVTNSFGVGLRHTVTMKKINEKWVIYNDWYTDCFEDALAAYSGDINSNMENPLILKIANFPKSFDINYNGKYDRMKAVEYADKYCGAANGTGNNFKYNNKYKDFTGIGGDCTNFASQILGDKEAGALKYDGTWFCNYYKYGNSQGSSAWVNADSFKNYLIYSGKGKILHKGTFNDLALPKENSNCAAVQELDLGDLVCYAKKGDMNHFAVITAWDSHGYPLVNSHTTDRYHVPWDLGWGDKDITFYLLHIR